MKWVIDKQFSFCYSHRVWSQELKDDFCATGDNQCKCRHWHGHEGLVHVFLEGEELERGMVTDFKHLGWLKNFLDSQIDHKFILDRNDPYFSKTLNIKGHIQTDDKGQYVEVRDEDDMNEVFTRLYLTPQKVPGTEFIAGYTLDVENSKLKLTEEIEVYEGIFIVDFLPTSEHLSKWVFDVVEAKMSLIDVDVAQVDWYETPKSRSSYRK